jgi:murein L,D-transpeptidase YcbB/YkuD
MRLGWVCAGLTWAAAPVSWAETPAAAPSTASPAAPAPASLGAEPEAGASAADRAPAEPAAATQAPEAPPSAQATASAVLDPETPAAQAIKRKLDASPADGTDEEKNERAALIEFYGARRFAPLWMEAKGLNADAAALKDEIGRASAWGLDPKDFALPDIAPAGQGAADIAPDALAAAEVELSLAALKYARFARGGRIIDPARDLDSNLDRRPQLLKPKVVIEELAAAPDKAAYLAATNPRSVQFERLRQQYLALGADKGGKAAESRDAKRILANMEMWRWMPDDLGDMYMMANVPTYMIELVKGATVLHTERIVAGEIGKQTSIFSRPLKSITFKPMWRVPESIKVKELWPSLLRGGGLMRQYGLELQTKDGRTLDYRSVDWTKTDIRDYEVVQPSGRKSVMGVVKFSFPSQHTIFMHDTPDKWMFNAKQRTLSHGCLRLRNPLAMAKLILAEDKGWDADKVDELVASGPGNNEVPMEKKIRMHIVYFTAWVDDAGKLKTYADIYGHEKRVTQALEGKWSQIVKGPDHLAPVVPNKALADKALATPAATKDSGSQSALNDFMSNFFGGL